MIYKETCVIPGDRCGVFWVKVFHLYGGWHRKVSTVGDFIKGSVRDTKTDNKLKKKTKVAGIIVRTCKEKSKLDSSSMQFQENNVILLKKRMTPKGHEVFGPLLWVVRRRKFRTSFSKIL